MSEAMLNKVVAEKDKIEKDIALMADSMQMSDACNA